MLTSLYRNSLAHAQQSDQRPERIDAFGNRSYQVLVPDEMVFSPALSQDLLLLEAIKRLRRSNQAPDMSREEETTHG